MTIVNATIRLDNLDRSERAELREALEDVGFTPQETMDETLVIEVDTDADDEPGTPETLEDELRGICEEFGADVTVVV